MSSLHVLEKLSLNIGHLSCIYYPFLACKRLVSVLLKIEMEPSDVQSEKFHNRLSEIIGHA